MQRVVTALLLALVSVRGIYEPGSPGAAWSQDEVIAVKAKLRMTFSKVLANQNTA